MIATRPYFKTGSIWTPKLYGDESLYLPLWRPSLGGSPTINSLDRNAHLCTVTGATWLPNGRSLDNTDDKIDCGNPTALNFTTNMTLIAIMKRNATGIANALISKDNNTTLRALFFEINTDNTFKYFVFKTDASYSAITSTTTLNATAYYHLGAVYQGVADGTSIMDLYVNGVKAATQITNAVYPIQQEAVNLILGARVGTIWGNGIFSEAWAYGRSFSEGDMMRHYQNSKARLPWLS